MNLVIFPHAGSGSSFYYEWKKRFEKDFSVSVIQYPLREHKYGIPMPSTLKELANEIFEQYREVFMADFVVWGHSFGSTLAYEVLRIVQLKLKKSAALFFSSGASAPCDEHTQFPSNIVNERSVLVKTLQKIGGIPKEMYLNKEYMDYYLPIISADINLLMNYRDLRCEKIQCPLVLLEGTDDEFVLTNWERYAKVVDIRFFEGGHFFFDENPEMFKNQILNELHKHNLKIANW